MLLFCRAVAIPEMFNACENKNHIDKRVSRFVIPFCVTLNADGSALFITTAAMFIANISGHPLTFGEVAIIGWVLLFIQYTRFRYNLSVYSLQTDYITVSLLHVFT